MRLEITAVPESEKPKLWDELQSYLAELSKLGGRAAMNGIFPYQYFNAYWQEPDRWPFWIKSEEAIAGFALVRKRDGGAFEMAEFYIRPEHRRSGIGAGSVRELFARSPGRWHLSEFKEHAAAIAFWRRVLQDLGAYEETVGAERVEQSFTSR